MIQNIGRISKPEAFLVLRDVVRGLGYIFKKYGPFTPMLNTIGINP